MQDYTTTEQWWKEKQEGYPVPAAHRADIGQSFLSFFTTIVPQQGSHLASSHPCLVPIHITGFSLVLFDKGGLEHQATVPDAVLVGPKAIATKVTGKQIDRKLWFKRKKHFDCTKYMQYHYSELAEAMGCWLG